MDKMKKLPDTEFEIMKAVWAIEPPISSYKIMQQLGDDNKWVIQVVISFLSRLVDRGFLRTEKIGRDRIYFPLVTREEYLEFETDNFIKQYHESSFINLINTLYKNKNLTDSDINELSEWFKERKE